MVGAPIPDFNLRRRIQLLEGRLAKQEQLIERLTSSRAAGKLNKADVFLAKTAADSSYPSSGNVFGIIFVTVSFTRREGSQTPSYQEHSASVQDFALSQNGWVEEGTYVWVRRQRNGQYVMLNAPPDTTELMLAEDHPGKGVVFKCYRGIWCPEDHTWRYDCTDGCADWAWAIDHRYDVPYPDIGARGLFTPRPSDTYGTIWECVSLDCSSPGACADQSISQPCPGSASTNYGGAC